MRPRTLIASTLASVALAVLVPSLATAEPIAATDVVVNVTAGANDPVSGATVVARGIGVSARSYRDAGCA